MLKKLLGVIIALAVVFLGSSFYVVYSGNQDLIEYTDDSKFDCILVLGCGIYADGTPTPMLRDRLDKGAELYKEGRAPKLLLSGDDGQIEYNEVEAMKNYVLSLGIPEEDIFLDHAGFSTYESMFRAKAIFDAKDVLVVTQKYHEFRALYIGKALGINTKGIPALETSYRGASMRELREVIARSKDFFKCILKPNPTYLGDKIDLKGDGRVSW